MTYDEAGKIIERLRLGSVPLPTRTELRQVYDAIYAEAGSHKEPLRTHIYDTPGLAIGWELGAKLQKYALAARISSKKTASKQIIL